MKIVKTIKTGEKRSTVITMIKSVFFICQIFLLILVFKLINGYIDLTEEKSKYRKSDEIIDPYSLYYNKQTKQLNTVIKLRPNNNNNNVKNHMWKQIFNDDHLNHQTNDIFEESFSRRLVNVLLSSVDFEENNDLLTGSILIELTSPQLQLLKNFGLGKARIRDVDPFIASIFKASERNSFYNIFLFMRNIVTYLVMHKEIISITLVVLYLSKLLLTVKWDVIKFFQASFFIIFITSFVIVYFQLLKDAEIKLTTKQIQFTELPVHCRPHLMSWWDKVWHMYGSFEDCQKYYEAREDSYFLHVTPAIALSHMISTFMLHPAESFGDAISKFVHQTTKNFWSPLQIIFVPLMTITIIAFLVVAFIFVAGGSLRWYMWPFTLFSLRRSSHNDEMQSLSSKDNRKPVEVLFNFNLNVSHDVDSPQIAIGPAHKNNSNQDIPIKTKQQELIKNKTVSENLSMITSDQTSGDLNISEDCLPGNTDTNKSKIEEVEICSGSGGN